MKLYPIITLILLGFLVSPVIGEEVFVLPNGDVASGDIGWDSYYHNDTGVREVYIHHSGVKQVYRNGTLVWTNDKDRDGVVDNWFDQPSPYLFSPLVSSNQPSSPNFGTFLTGFAKSNPVNNFQTPASTFSPKNLLSSFAKQNMQVY